MPVVKDIAGRTEDIVTGRDGRKMVRFHGLYINLPNIIQGQVIQKSYDNYIIKIVSQSLLSATEKETITQRMKSQLGNDVTITVEEVKHIPVGPNGKYKAVISEVS
jgi:phenylacetate-CoA ligase